MLTATRNRLTPDIHGVIVRHGTAGQMSATVTYQYPCEDFPSIVEFIGNVDGGPVDIILSSGTQLTVSGEARRKTDAGGSFGADPESWVRRFYA